jgi:hypothetical protein
MAFSAAVGFLAGSRVGRGPYEKVESKTRELSGRPEVRKVVDTADRAIHEKVHDAHAVAAEKVDHLKNVVGGKTPFRTRGDETSSFEVPRSDPQDHAFGVAAEHDQKIVDQLGSEGVSEEDLPAEPMRHPRAGGKAAPVENDDNS